MRSKFNGNVASPALGGQEWLKVMSVSDTHFVYILRSKKDGKRCIGLTNSLDKRLEQHNAGKVTSTKNRRPFELIYFEKFTDRKFAAKREKFFKSGKGREFLDSINK